MATEQRPLTRIMTQSQPPVTIQQGRSYWARAFAKLPHGPFFRTKLLLEHLEPGLQRLRQPGHGRTQQTSRSKDLSGHQPDPMGTTSSDRSSRLQGNFARPGNEMHNVPSHPEAPCTKFLTPMKSSFLIRATVCGILARGVLSNQRLACVYDGQQSSTSKQFAK